MKLKLDKKIPNPSCIFTCFDTECAEQYIGKQGYFTSCYSNFSNINKLLKGRLTGIDESLVSEKYHANVGNANVRKEYYSFFLPEDYLKPVEKKYRPYTLEEFQKIFTIGQPIKFRFTGINTEKTLLLIGYEIFYEGNNPEPYILIGYETFKLDELLEEYEWQESDSNVWKPFGVEE